MLATDDSDAAVLRESAARSAEQLESEIQRILDTSQLEAGQLRLEWQPLALPQFLYGALLSLETQAQLRNLAFTIKVVPEVETLWGDAALLARVVQNLVGNALKFTSAGGQVDVRLSLAPSGKEVELHVRDSGDGISPARIGRIFERYVQGSDGDRRGSGLGLYFCRLAAEAHGGSIRAESQLGLGTAFTLVLPPRATRGIRRCGARDRPAAERVAPDCSAQRYAGAPAA